MPPSARPAADEPGPVALSHTSATNVSPALPQGAIVQGKYRVNGLLEAGPAAAAYRAEQVETGRAVVLRLFTEPRASSIQEGLRPNSQRASRSGLPDSFVEVVDLGVTDDRREYLVTEFVQGPSLADLVKQTPPLEPVRALELAMRIGEAIQQALNLGFVDIPLAPGEIVVDGDGRIKLLRSDALILDRLGLGDRAGKIQAPIRDPRYLSLDELAGLPTTERDVVYRFGLLLYELLCGRPLFEGRTVTEIREQQLKAPSGHVPHRLRTYPPSLGRIVAQLLDSNPVRRPPDLTSILNELWEATWLLRPNESSGRSRMTLTLSGFSRARRWTAWGLSIVVLGVGVLVAWRYVARIPHEPAAVPVSAVSMDGSAPLRPASSPEPNAHPNATDEPIRGAPAAVGSHAPPSSPRAGQSAPASDPVASHAVPPQGATAAAGAVSGRVVEPPLPGKPVPLPPARPRRARNRSRGA